jgi:hypothetical protein
MQHQAPMPAYKNPPFVPSLSQINTVHTLKIYFKTIFNFTFLPTPRPPKFLVLMFKLFATVGIEVGTFQW